MRTTRYLLLATMPLLMVGCGKAGSQAPSDPRFVSKAAEERAHAKEQEAAKAEAERLAALAALPALAHIEFSEGVLARYNARSAWTMTTLRTGSSPKVEPVTVTDAELKETQTRLAMVKTDDPLAGRAVKVRESLAAAQAKYAADTKAWAKEQARISYAQTFENKMLEEGMSVTIRAIGKSHEVLHFKYALVSKAFVPPAHETVRNEGWDT